MDQIPSTDHHVTIARLYQQLSGGKRLACLTPAQLNQLMMQSGLTEQDVCLALLPQAATFALTPISDFQVGAIAIGCSGNLYFGANMELTGANLSQTIHAEQAAMTHAWLRGETGILKLFVSASPCGYCRQFMTELSTAQTLEIILPNEPPRALTDYLPHAFGPGDLGITDQFMTPLTHQFSSHQLSTLEQAACAALNRSYAPYSHAYSGIALRLSDTTVIQGAYAENAAFNPSLSPLHTAIILLLMSGYPLSMIEEAALVEVQDSPLHHYELSKALLQAINPQIQLTHATVTDSQD